jgi:predicted flap endonuclease-1-like 5' DNA nuclease
MLTRAADPIRTGWYEEVAVPDNPRHYDDVAGADDLTRIGGIGSKIADRLYAAGILTYADLASRSADEISKLLSDVTGLPAGRLDSWRDQARELAAAAAQAAPASPAAEVPAGAASDGQHYESFLVRVLLNEDGSVRRTTAQHIRTGAERHWPGLERQALPEFIETAIASATPSAEPPSDRVRHAEAVDAPTEPVTVEATPSEPVAVDDGAYGADRGSVRRARHASRGRAVHHDDSHRLRRGGEPWRPARLQRHHRGPADGRRTQADGRRVRRAPCHHVVCYHHRRSRTAARGVPA